jgi:CheY-like chemotaxis protein
VLVVDDDPLVLSGTAAMLEDLGHEVTVAQSADEAIRRLAASDALPDLLLTDQVMPGMTGIELIAEARRRWPWIPAILASGFAELPDGADAAEYKLRKPFSQDLLRKALAACSTTRQNVHPLVAKRG